MSIYSTRKSKNQKNGPSGAPGPASEIVNILVAVEGDPLEKKQIFEKSLTKPEN